MKHDLQVKCVLDNVGVSIMRIIFETLEAEIVELVHTLYIPACRLQAIRPSHHCSVYIVEVTQSPYSGQTAVSPEFVR